ncbi:MAG: hypothetical protein HY796_09045 [Elusimicrobia bacterium]|nr:hypothetical protein [Elusimicrobiota bacterium]
MYPYGKISVNLAFHEAGHIFLGFFGEFIRTLGGTLSQVLIPSACAVHFLRRGSRLGAQLCLFWVGENLLNISIYAGDAIKQELPLVGGGCHDWTYLLTEMELIAHTEGTARVIFWAGSAVIFYSLYLIGNDAFKPRPPRGCCINPGFTQGYTVYCSGRIHPTLHMVCDKSHRYFVQQAP